MNPRPGGPAEEFVPAPWLRGPHAQTIVPVLLPAARVAGAGERVVRVADVAAVTVRVSTPPGAARGTLLLVHGLGGSVESPYMRRTARSAARDGWVAVRMNCRNAGGTERLSRTLFNAGQSDDVGRVLSALEDSRLPRPFAIVGYSLGGNLVLRYASVAGVECRAAAVVALNPPVDLEACTRALERPGNRIYGLFFTRELCRLLVRIRRLRPVAGPPARWWRIRTVRGFDAAFIAPDAGHPSAEAYYAHASSGPLLHRLRVPALVISAADDPIVEPSIFDPYRRLSPERIAFVHPSHGGHLGYWQRGRPRFWAARAMLGFLDRALPRGLAPAAPRACRCKPRRGFPAPPGPAA